MHHVIRLDKKIAAVALLAVIFAAFAVACGSDSGASGGEAAFPKVVASDRIYTIDDLKDAGIKAVKKYDVEDLPGAEFAWRTVYNQLDYEARFYATHEDAVAQGTSFADSVTGEDAIITGDEIMWEEGSKDRRKCSRASWTPHSGCSYSPRYLEYVIRGNLILFCEGNESTDAFDNCENLLTLLADPV